MYDELVEALRLCVKYGKAQDALENAEQAADAIEKLVGKTDRFRWIPVTERLPNEYVSVLCYCSRNGQHGCGE